MIFVRVCLMVALLLSASWSYAQTTCTQYRIGGTYGQEWKLSKEDACKTWFETGKAAGHSGFVNGGTPGTGTWYTRTYYSEPTQCYIWTITSTRNASTGVVTTTEAGSSYNGYQTQQSTNCNPCVQNLRRDMSVRVGWSRATARSDGALWKTSDGREFFAAIPGQGDIYGKKPPDIMCDGQCKWVSDGATGDWWADKDPNGKGNYGIYRQQGYLSIGEQCATKDESIDPANSGPTCDGFLGTINGKTSCVQKSAPTGLEGRQPKATQTPAGGTPTQTTDSGGGGEKYGPNGERFSKPGDTPGLPDVSGTGVGTPSTPTTGTTTQTLPDGTKTTTTINMDVQTCGLPGKPACKMDESGTPSGYGSDGKDGQAALAKAAGDRDTGLASILAPGGKDATWSMPDWFAAGSCKAWDLGTLPVIEAKIEIDMCKIKPFVEGAMSFLWIVSTFLACLGVVERTMFAGAR